MKRLADSMFVVMGVALALGLILASVAIYTKTVTISEQADIQLERLKAYSCEEMIMKHTTAHYFSKENEHYAIQKIDSCNSAKNDLRT